MDNTGSKLKVLDRLPFGSKNYLLNYWNTTKAVLTSPKEFFENMPVEGGLNEPFQFLLISCLISTICTAILSWHLAYLPTGLIMGLAACFVASAVSLFLARAMGGKGSFEATFRAFAYSSCIQLLSWFPIIGALAGIYGLALIYHGLKRAQGLAQMKTLVIVFLSGFLTSFIILLGMLLTFLKNLLPG